MAATRQKKRQWEQFTETVSRSAVDATLKIYGDDGYEFVMATSSSDQFTLFFKREKK